MSDLVTIARQRIDDTQRTHWEGCERDHRECLIRRMADEIERLRNELRKSHEHQHEAEALAGHYLVQRDDARDALAAERERCAQVCDDEARLWEAAGNGPAAEARLCAARIRELA